VFTFSWVCFYSLTIIFNTYVLHLKVETAVISAPIETMVATAAGLISAVYVTPGKIVKKGTPLIKIENIELLRDLQLTKVHVDDAQLNISYTQSLLANEQRRLQVYQQVGADRVASADAIATMSKQTMATAKNNLRRMQVLHAKHYLSKAVVYTSRTRKKRLVQATNAGSGNNNYEDRLGGLDDVLLF
jgi:multidrug resistance efflux pump